MITTLSPEKLQRLREIYRHGTRVELLSMDDAQAPAKGTRGTVTGVDDTGSLMVRWDNGSSLNVLYGIDSVTIVAKQEEKKE